MMSIIDQRLICQEGHVLGSTSDWSWYNITINQFFFSLPISCLWFKGYDTVRVCLIGFIQENIFLGKNSHSHSCANGQTLPSRVSQIFCHQLYYYFHFGCRSNNLNLCRFTVLLQWLFLAFIMSVMRAEPTFIIDNSLR